MKCVKIKISLLGDPLTEECTSNDTLIENIQGIYYIVFFCNVSNSIYKEFKVT